MNVPLLLGILSVPVAGGVVGTRIWVKRREQGTIAARLSRLVFPSAPAAPRTLLKKSPWITLNWQFVSAMPGFIFLKQILSESGLENQLSNFLVLELWLLSLPALIAITFDLNIFAGICLGLVLLFFPFIFLKARARTLRTKFCEQLPDAIDLMVAVLRSGHSVAQSVKSVAQELPSPCGPEFEAILHRMNLGQPLSQSLTISAQRFHSYELDLIRRAVAIQMEVGGSLAELLDKTNSTLRERLKLAKQLRILTAQSRLSAQIVALLPIVLALGLNAMSPGYLQLLIQDNLGRGLLCASIFLEVIGIFIMQRMSTMRI